MKYLLLKPDGSVVTSETRIGLVEATGMVTFNLAARTARIKQIEAVLSYSQEFTEKEFFADASRSALALLVRDFGYKLYVEASPVF